MIRGIRTLLLQMHQTQVPWETTSLEGDVFVFPEGESRAGASEAARAVEAELDDEIPF